MGLKEEIKDWMQPDGLISPDFKPTPDSTGNGILYTSLYNILLVRRGEARCEDRELFESTISKCAITWPGLFFRSPTKRNEQNGPDDYIALALAAQKMNSSFARDIVFYGERIGCIGTNWVFNNLDPQKFSFQAWFGRMPQVIAHFYYCALRQVSFLRQTAWALSILFSSFKVADTTDAMLSWCLVQAHPDLGGMAGAFWTSRFYSKWPRGMKDVLAEHLSDSHPLSKYWI